MTIFVPEMLATSSTDGFLHSNLQTGAPKITPPTAPTLSCWSPSQKGSLFQFFPPPPKACVPAWPPLPEKGSEQLEKESRSEWEVPRLSTASERSIIHKRQEHKTLWKCPDKLVIYISFHLPHQIKTNLKKKKDLPKFHLLSKAWSNNKSFLLKERLKNGGRKQSRPQYD